MSVSVCTRNAALLGERGQFGNVVCRPRRGEAGTEIRIVGKVICNAWQVRQVGGHIDLGYLTQVWHIEIRLRCLLGEKMSTRELITYTSESSKRGIEGKMGPTCLSNCSLLVIDNGASNGFSSFSVSNVVCVFVTAPARGSRKTYFLYLPKHTNASIRRKYFMKCFCTCVCVFVCVDSQVLCRIEQQKGADR